MRYKVLTGLTRLLLVSRRCLHINWPLEFSLDEYILKRSASFITDNWWFLKNLPQQWLLHAPGVAKGFIKGEALRLLRTNSSKPLFEENISNFKSRLRERGYPSDLVEKILSEVKFTERKSALQEKQKVRKNILPFVTQYNPSVPNLKKIIMSKWHLIQQQPLLREIFKEPPIICYKRGRSLKDLLVKAKL